MARLRTNVWVGGQWYGPAYPDAGDPPRGTVSNPQAFEGGNDQTEAVEVEVTVHDGDGTTREGTAEAVSTTSGGEPPPQGGPGSSRSAWLDYAAALSVDVAEDASREDIIAACEAAGVPTE